MFGQSIVLAILAAAPTSIPADDYDVASVEIMKVESCVHVVALDGEANFSASIVLCGDEAGRLYIDADFADDLYLSLRYDGHELTMSESNGARESAARMVTVLNYLGPVDVQEGWGSCLFSTAGAVAAAAAASPWVVPGAYAMACDCLPLLIEEFEGMSCPLW